MLFARQSIQDDNCAICATTMLLAIYGNHRRRQEVSARYARERTNERYVTRNDITRVIAAFMPNGIAIWQHKKFATPSDLGHFSAKLLHDQPAILVTAHCTYGPLRLRAQHAFLIVGTDEHGVNILDPLGRRPKNGQTSNALLSSECTTHQEANVQGACWSLNLSRPLSFLFLGVVPCQTNAPVC